MRALFKALAERSLVAAGAPALLRSVRGGDAVILNYHNVVPDGAPPGGDRSLHLPRSVFGRHLDLLAETHRLVDLASAIRGRGPGGGRPLAAVTLDDGYRGALTVGLEELRARGVPCTVFVPPALLGAGSLWWDALAPTGPGGLPDAIREEALARAKGRPEDVRRWAEERGLTPRSQPDHAGLVDEDELREVAGLEGVSVGAHGWTHADLTRLDPDDLREELRRPLLWLRDRFAESLVPWLSLPYGRSAENVVSAALEAGYRGVLDLSGGPVGDDDRAAAGRIPRQNVPAGLSPAGLLLRAAGL